MNGQCKASYVHGYIKITNNNWEQDGVKETAFNQMNTARWWEGVAPLCAWQCVCVCGAVAEEEGRHRLKKLAVPVLFEWNNCSCQPGRRERREISTEDEEEEMDIVPDPAVVDLPSPRTKHCEMRSTSLDDRWKNWPLGITLATVYIKRGCCSFRSISYNYTDTEMNENKINSLLESNFMKSIFYRFSLGILGAHPLLPCMVRVTETQTAAKSSAEVKLPFICVAMNWSYILQLLRILPLVPTWVA